MIAKDATIEPLSDAPVTVQLVTLADWFDNPNESPPVTVYVGGVAHTPGFLLRQCAAALRIQELRVRDADLNEETRPWATGGGQ